jgi:transcriptional regulator with XRE-family HTH domain
MSKKVDTDFPDRLMKAALHKKVAYSQSALATFIGGVNRQTVDTWMKGSLPRADKLFEMADKFGVDARWFATGIGDMLPPPRRTVPTAGNDLAPQEEDLIARYRGADPRWQLSLRLMAALATEEQLEFASDVNYIIARLQGKKPTEVRYASNARVAAAFGEAPHVAERKAKLKGG